MPEDGAHGVEIQNFPTVVTTAEVELDAESTESGWPSGCIGGPEEAGTTEGAAAPGTMVEPDSGCEAAAAAEVNVGTPDIGTVETT